MGEVLRKPLHFLSRHLWGFLIVNGFVLSLVVMLGALFAYLFRLLDAPPVSRFVAQLGFYGDIRRAFFPAAVAMLLWGAAFGLSNIFRRLRINAPPFSTWGYTTFVILAVLGLVSLLSTSNVDTDAINVKHGGATETGDFIREAIQWLQRGLMILVVASITPYLNFRALLRSGTAPRWKLETWFFNVVSTIALAGVPLFLFAWIAQENISGWNSKRPDHGAMAQTHIRDWRDWGRHFAPPPANSNEPAGNVLALDREIRKRLAETKLDSGSSKLAEDPHSTPFVEILELQRQVDYRTTHDWMWEYWFAAFGELTHQENDFSDRLHAAERLARWKDQMTEDFNRKVLADPCLYQQAEVSTGDALKRDRDLLKSRGLDSIDDVKSRGSQLERALRQFLLRDLPKARQFESHSENGAKLASLLRKKKPGVTASDVGKEGVLPEPESDQLPLFDELDDDFLLSYEKLLNEELSAARLVHGDRAVTDDPGTRNRLAKVGNRLEECQQLLNKIRVNNWSLIRSHLLLTQNKDFLYPPEEVFAKVVNSSDQSYRLEILLYSFLSFLAIGAFFSVNPTFIHGYYRDQLAQQWIECHPEYGRQIPLAKLQNCAKGGPLHLLTGALMHFGRLRKPDDDSTSRFTFSQTFSGAKRIGYAQTGEYGRGRIELADAMAISGAAVSLPALNSILIRFLLLVTNFRLGQWVPNPVRPISDLSSPTPIRLLFDFLARDSEDQAYLYVADGGLVDNTAISPLLQRRARVIIACDASEDGRYEFADLRKLISEGESRYGVQFSMVDGQHPIRLDAVSMFPPKDSSPERDKGSPSSSAVPPAAVSARRLLAERSYLVIRIQYPDDEETREAFGGSSGPLKAQDRVGYLIYIKPTLTGKEPADLLYYRNTRPDFPQDPTKEQFFDPIQFQMYRRLGEQLGEVVARECFSGLNTTKDFLWNWTPKADPGPSIFTSVHLEPLPHIHSSPVSGPLYRGQLSHHLYDGVEVWPPLDRSKANVSPDEPPAGEAKPVVTTEVPNLEKTRTSPESSPEEPGRGATSANGSHVPTKGHRPNVLRDYDSLFGDWNMETVSAVKDGISKRAILDRLWVCYSILENDAAARANAEVRDRVIAILREAFRHERVSQVQEKICSAIAHLGLRSDPARRFFEEVRQDDGTSKALRKLCADLLNALVAGGAVPANEPPQESGPSTNPHPGKPK